MMRYRIKSLYDNKMLIGYPIKEYELLDNENNPVWIAEKALDFYLKGELAMTPTGNSRMSYAVPEWVPTDDTPTLVLFDDYSRSDSRQMQATMELVQRGEYISWKLPKNCHIVLTSNPDNGDYNVTSIDAAQRTRYIRLFGKFDIGGWAKWAELNKMNPQVINFCLFNPEIFEESNKSGVTPRSMELFANAISTIEYYNSENLALISMIAEGCFESETSAIGQMFAMFVNNKLDKLPTVQQMMFDPEKEIFKTIYDLIHEDKGATYRSDIAYVLSTRLMNFIISLIKDNKIEREAILKRLNAFMNYKHKIFTDDLSFKMLQTISQQDSELCTLMCREEKYRKIIFTK